MVQVHRVGKTVWCVEFQHHRAWMHELTTSLGPLMMLDIMGEKMCIINSAKVATELLDQRSAIYSDRPGMVMVKEL